MNNKYKNSDKRKNTLEYLIRFENVQNILSWHKDFSFSIKYFFPSRNTNNKPYKILNRTVITYSAELRLLTD